MMEPIVSDAWERGSPYEQYVGRWSRRVAPEFLSWLKFPACRDWLDIGCGTGALSAAILDQASPRSLAAVEPSDGFRAAAQQNLGQRVALVPGSATAIPLASASVHIAVSGLVLNFVSDPQAALAEMARVTGPGGVIALYVWDYAEKMEFMRWFWDIAVALDPAAATLDEGVRFPLCRPKSLEGLFAAAGLTGIELAPIDIPTRFASFDDFWRPFLGGQGPAPSYVKSLSAPARARLQDRLHNELPVADDGSISLIARAWAVRGTVGP